MTLRFTVPLTPPSVNHYKAKARNGHWYVTDEALAFKGEVARSACGRAVEGKFYEVDVTIYLGYKKSGDVDNFAKCVLDGLVEAEVIESDARITDLTLRKRRDIREPRTEITIEGKP